MSKQTSGQGDSSFVPFFLAVILSFTLPFAGSAWRVVFGLIVALFLFGCVLVTAAAKKDE